MRRPGYLHGHTCWFGELEDSCWVCQGNRCKNICPPKVQLQRAQKKFKAMRQAAVGKYYTTKGVNPDDFKMVEGESQRDRLNRLATKGLYTPGASMSQEYGNLVHYGTTDTAQIKAEMRKKQEWQRQENLRRYGTSDVRKVRQIVKEETQERNAIWRRIYGTDDPGEVFAIPDSRRKAICDADSACVAFRKKEEARGAVSTQLAGIEIKSVAKIGAFIAVPIVAYLLLRSK